MMVFPTSSMNELNNKCSKKAAVFFFNRSRWICSSNMAVLSERKGQFLAVLTQIITTFSFHPVPGPWLRCQLPSSITKSLSVHSIDHQGIPHFIVYSTTLLSSLLHITQGLHREGDERHLARATITTQQPETKISALTPSTSGDKPQGLLQRLSSEIPKPHNIPPAARSAQAPK